jgi:hypothetical protein
MHDGRVGKRPVAYVGQAGKLRERVQQHLLRRDSSVTTGASIVSLNPDLVRAVEWWEHERFTAADVLGAAELVAFDVLDPVLRSQGRPTTAARTLYADTAFREEFRLLFCGSPSGALSIESLASLSARLQNLEARLEEIEGKLQSKGRLPTPPGSPSGGRV